MELRAGEPGKTSDSILDEAIEERRRDQAGGVFEIGERGARLPDQGERGAQLAAGAVENGHRLVEIAAMEQQDRKLDAAVAALERCTRVLPIAPGEPHQNAL